MPEAGRQGRDVPGEPPFLVERGVTHRGGIPDRQGQPGTARLAGGLHHQSLLFYFDAGQVKRRILQSRCLDRFPGGSSPAVPVQISVFWTLPYRPGHTRKICSAVRADHPAKAVSGKRMPEIEIVYSWHSLSVFKFPSSFSKSALQSVKSPLYDN